MICLPDRFPETEELLQVLVEIARDCTDKGSTAVDSPCQGPMLFLERLRDLASIEQGFQVEPFNFPDDASRPLSGSLSLSASPADSALRISQSPSLLPTAIRGACRRGPA